MLKPSELDLAAERTQMRIAEFEAAEDATASADIKRQKLGVILVARRMHFALNSTDIESKKARILGDVAFLQRRLTEWKDDGTNFGKATRNLVAMAICDAAKDLRLKVASEQSTTCRL